MRHVMAARSPLLSLDPGWLFLVAGLALCSSGILIPAKDDRDSLTRQLAALQMEKVKAETRLRTYAEFLDDLERQDPALIRRLAAIQLNLMPRGDVPLLVTSGHTAAITDGIDTTVPRRLPRGAPATAEPPETVLERLVTGPLRLWVFAVGALSVFVGLILSPELNASGTAAPSGNDRDRTWRRRAGPPDAGVPVTSLVGGWEPERSCSVDVAAPADRLEPTVVRSIDDEEVDEEWDEDDPSTGDEAEGSRLCADSAGEDEDDFEEDEAYVDEEADEDDEEDDEEEDEDEDLDDDPDGEEIDDEDEEEEEELEEEELHEDEDPDTDSEDSEDPDYEYENDEEEGYEESEEGAEEDDAEDD